MQSRKKYGKIGEDVAVNYLERIGYKILERNYRFENNEIDIIAEDGEDLVFIEVKTRSSNLFGEPEDAVTEEKQEKIQLASEGYYFERQIENRSCRFDVIAIELKNGGAEIRHLKDAF